MIKERTIFYYEIENKTSKGRTFFVWYVPKQTILRIYISLKKMNMRFLKIFCLPLAMINV